VLKFSVHRRHPSPAAATEFLLLHGAGLTALEGPVTLVSEGAGGGTFHLHSAVLKRIQGSQEGTATVHGYEIIGGGLTDHLPEGN
jgi:hypothetical protein